MKTVLIVAFLLGVFASTQGLIEAGPEMENNQISDIIEVGDDAGLFHFDYSKSSQVPAEVNWTERRAVSPIVDEQHWRNSWAFAVTSLHIIILYKSDNSLQTEFS